MSQGLQIFDGGGQLQFDSAARLGRVIYAGPANASGCPNQVWTQVVDPAYASRLWGVMIPNYALDNSLESQLYLAVASVIFDPINQPGKAFVSGSWYNPETQVTTDYPYQNSTLIVGVY
jgi:hypothetical protein